MTDVNKQKQKEFKFSLSFGFLGLFRNHLFGMIIPSSGLYLLRANFTDIQVSRSRKPPPLKTSWVNEADGSSAAARCLYETGAGREANPAELILIRIAGAITTALRPQV